MGAGDFEAGPLDPAGEDPVADPPAPRRVTLPAALLFDGATADFPLDSAGLYKSSHTVDQRVALALIPRQGTVASVPGLGSRLRSIKRATGALAVAKARDYVDLALAALVLAGDIEVVDVQVESPGRGQIAVAVTYKNLRVTEPPTTVRFNP